MGNSFRGVKHVCKGRQTPRLAAEVLLWAAHVTPCASRERQQLSVASHFQGQSESAACAVQDWYQTLQAAFVSQCAPGSYGCEKQRPKCQQFMFLLNRLKAQGCSVLGPSSSVCEAQGEGSLPSSTVTVTPGLASSAFFPQGHIIHLKDLVLDNYSYLWVRPSVSREQLQTISVEVDEIGKLVLGLMTKPAAVWTIEELNKDLRNIQKETRETKYSSMMKLLRMAISGQQHGPSVAEMMVTLGPREVCGRIHKVLSS